MDDRRFDSLAKAVASGASRRSVIKGILGLGGTAIAGSVLLGGDAEAARRPTPTPKPVKCPGRQTWSGSQCVCPGDAPEKCGPDCCSGTNNDPYPRPADHSECCDNACCFGTCYGEELCCPTNSTAGEGGPIADVCESGECCYLPDVCSNGVCRPPSGCETNEDCVDCETCNPETGQCSSLCTNDLPQCCVNEFGEYCIPAEETCCSDPSHCTEPCSYCNDVVKYCVDRCEGGDLCCEGANGDECCAADQCVAGQGCCPEGFVACGGSCCNTTNHFCNAEEVCDCLPGTEPCSLLPGGCCPEGQCNDAFECCSEGTSPCGSSCCEEQTQFCGPKTCAVQGYFDDCAECVDGECLTAPYEGYPCGFDGFCSYGICKTCIPSGSPCPTNAGCCSNNCVYSNNVYTCGDR